MKLPHTWTAAIPVFDDEHLVSCAGLVPVMELAEQAGLSQLITDRVHVDAARVASAGVNPAGKITSIIAGMAAGADYIDDLDMIRSGGMARMFTDVYAPATLGQFLREFTHGYTRQLASAARAHLVNLVGTNSTEPAPQADLTHRAHAIIETVHSDLIDGPMAHLPSASFAANQAWVICAGMCHNLLRAAGTLAGGRHHLARGATLRHRLVMVPARIAQPARRKVLHLPAHWPWDDHWITLWDNVFHHDEGPPLAA